LWITSCKSCEETGLLPTSYCIVIYLSKILPVLVLPMAWVFILCIWGAIRKSRALVLSGVTVLYLASIPLVSDPLFGLVEGGQERIPAADARCADAIVVLSGMLRAPRGSAQITEWGDPNRFFGGVELFKAGKAPRLVFTGGWIPWEPDAPLEGEVLMNFAEKFDVPRSAMLTTGRVSNTADEAEAVAVLLSGSSSATTTCTKPKILLVTSAYHMKRARALFERAGLQVIPFPVDFQISATKKLTPMDFLPSAGSLGATETALRELCGRMFWAIFKR